MPQSEKVENAVAGTAPPEVQRVLDAIFAYARLEISGERLSEVLGVNRADVSFLSPLQGTQGAGSVPMSADPMTDPRSGGTPAAAPETERTDQSALNRPIRPGMNRYRIHNTDGTTTTIEARSITQAREVALMLRRDFHCIESL